MSEQQSEPTSGETGTIGTGPAAPDLSVAKAPVTAVASVEVESPRLAPEQEETSPKPDAPKAEMPKAEMPKAEAFKVEPVKAESPAAEAARAETVKPETVKPETVKAEPPPIPGKLLIMSHADRAWNGDAVLSPLIAQRSHARRNDTEGSRVTRRHAAALRLRER